MRYVLGIDFGGGASKATLLSAEGKAVATATTEYPTAYGEGGMAEQDPRDWYSAACRNIRSVLASANVRGEEVSCVCFDAATHTAVLLDEEFHVLRRAIYWTDTRSRKQAERLQKEYGADIFRRFKHCPDTIWTLPQLLWVKENEPEIWTRTKRILFAKDYARHCFTGDFVTDCIEAQGSMFYDFDAACWSAPYLAMLGLTNENLPRLVRPLDEAGKILPNAAKASGLAAGTPVICGATDTAMEVFAAGAVKRGDMTIKLATAGRICLVTDTLVADEQLVSYSHVAEGLYYPGTATKSCAASLRWFRDTFGGDYAAFDETAGNIPAGSGGLLFHPYLNGELTPYGDPALRGGFTGVFAAHTKAHFARAVMEGVALSLKDCLHYLKEKGYPISDSGVILGGGAKSVLWRQITADALNLRLVTVENSDSSFGAAMCAGVAAGFFSSLQAAAEKCCKRTGIVVPEAKNAAVYEKLYPRYKKTAEFFGSLSYEG